MPTKGEGAPPTFEVLRQLAKQFRGRISKANLLALGGSLTKVLRTNYRGRKTLVWANASFLVLEVRGEYEDIGGLSIRPLGPAPQTREPVRLLQANGRRFAVYSLVGPLDACLERFLNSEIPIRLLAAVTLEEREHLTVYSDQIKLYLLGPELERVLNAIDHIIDLIPQSSVVQTQSDFSDLPSEFAPLLPLLSKWALSDDEDRSLKLKHSSTAARKKLVQTVDPLMSRICEYLDANPLTNTASALDSLAQAAMEANLLLQATAALPKPSSA